MTPPTNVVEYIGASLSLSASLIMSGGTFYPLSSYQDAPESSVESEEKISMQPTATTRTFNLR